MPHCCAVNCNNEQKYGCGTGRSFHKFPFSQPDVLKQWIVNVRREEWEPKKRSVICSDHFEEEHFDRTGQTVRLRKGAIPTIFHFPLHIHQFQSVIKRTSPRKRCLQDEIQKYRASTSFRKGSIVHQEHPYSVSPQRMQKKYRRVNANVAKKVEPTKQSVRRLKRM